MAAAETSFVLVSVIFGVRTIASVLYLGIGGVTVAPVVSVTAIVLAASIWKIRPWFLVAAAFSRSVWMVVMDVGILKLILCGIGNRTVEPKVLGAISRCLRQFGELDIILFWWWLGAIVCGWCLSM